MNSQAKYRLQYLEPAVEDLKLVKKNQGDQFAQDILNTIRQLQDNPYPDNSEIFSGLDIEDCYKLKVDSQIIVYTVDEPILLILVIAVTDPKYIYDDLFNGRYS